VNEHVLKCKKLFKPIAKFLSEITILVRMITFESYASLSKNSLTLLC